MEITVNMEQAYAAYAQLTDEEKNAVRRFMNSPVRQVIAKVFGPDVDRALGTFAEADPMGGFVEPRA